MCFSANVSFIASGVLAGLGALSIWQARTPKLRLFAITPLLFAIQQAAEGIIWLNSNDPTSGWYVYSTYVFLFFAMIWWPLWIPITIGYLEKDAFRRQLITIADFCGIWFSIGALIALIRAGAQATIMHHHIAYTIPGLRNDMIGFLVGTLAAIIVLLCRKIRHEWLAWVLVPIIVGSGFYYKESIDATSLVYLMTVTLPCFASSVRYMWIFGVGISASLLATMYFFPYTIGSVWCFWAALLSALTIVIVRQKE